MKNSKFLSLVAIPFIGFSGFTAQTSAPTPSPKVQTSINSNISSSTNPSTVTVFGDELPNVDNKPVGLLWKIAADLQATMTAEQKGRLFERMDAMKNQHQRQMQGGRRGMMGRGMMGRGMMGRQGMRQRGGNGMLGGVESILTPEQMEGLREKYKSEMPGAEIREQAKQAMVQALNLSPRQQQDLEALRNNTREQIKALHEQGKTSNADKKALQEKVKQLHENAKTSRERILTPKQQEIVKIHQALVMKAKMQQRGGQHQMQGGRGNRGGRMGQPMRGGRMGQQPMRGGMMQPRGNRF